MRRWMPSHESAGTSASSKDRPSRALVSSYDRSSMVLVVQLLAVTPAGSVVGWCDIVRNQNDGFRHVGRLGMGLLPDYRGRGLGKRLAIETIRAARGRGVERIELEVFASNATAIALYRRPGFVTEGVRRRARMLDGQYDHNLMMALLEDVISMGTRTDVNR